MNKCLHFKMNIDSFSLCEKKKKSSNWHWNISRKNLQPDRKEKRIKASVEGAIRKSVVGKIFCWDFLSGILCNQDRKNDGRRSAHEINFPRNGLKWNRRREISFSMQKLKTIFHVWNCKCLSKLASPLSIWLNGSSHLALFLWSRFSLLAQFNSVY